MNRRGAPYLLRASLARRQPGASLVTRQVPEQREPLALRAAPPDAVGHGVPQRPGQTGALDLAGMTDLLGLVDLKPRRAGLAYREEQFGVRTAAGRAFLHWLESSYTKRHSTSSGCMKTHELEQA